jgi:hypothetical protein
MGSLERRIRILEDLYHSSAGEEPGRAEQREREFLEKLRKVREKAEMEERMGDTRRRRALDEFEEFL